MACEKTKYVGRDVVLEVAIGCGDAMPASGDWKRFGSMRTKEFNLEWETTDATADDSVGALRENLATFQTLSISGDGTLKKAGQGGATLTEITKHFVDPSATAGQPTVWMRMTFPDLTFTAFMLLSNMSRSAPYDDIATYSLEASATASDFGLIVEDTPDPDAADVTSVAVFPDTLSLAVGATAGLAKTVAPTDAPQGVIWSSSDTSIALVNATSGVVTGVAVGTATITATSTSDSSKKDTSAVTVTA